MTTSRARASKRTPRALAASDRALLETLTTVVSRLAEAVPATTEIVLHDLRKLPSSIVAVAGNVTRRSVGDPPTDVLLEYLASRSQEDLLSYPTDLPGGRTLQSSTLIFRDQFGEPMAALCVNNDVTHWLALRELANSALGPGHDRTGIAQPSSSDPLSAVLGLAGTTGVPVAVDERPRQDTPSSEWFAHDVDELADHMIAKAIADVGVPVDLMRKEHKMRVVQELETRGMFLIRDSIETVAATLQVTRFTIYNYLNELSTDTNGATRRKAPPTTRTKPKASNQ